MKTRDYAAYKGVFEPLVLLEGMRPDRIYCDYEARLHQAAEAQLPEAVVKGCYSSYCIVSTLWQCVVN